MPVKALVFSSLLLFPLLAVAGESDPVCLDYWSVGPSGCKGRGGPVPEDRVEKWRKFYEEQAKRAEQPAQERPKDSEVEVIGGGQPEEQEEAKPQEKTMDERVDEFFATYDKPPREFVEFNLEPTMENAVKWVRKYNQMISRSSELTKAWQQASKVYDAYKKAGRLDELPELDTPEKEVPDFGISTAEQPTSEEDAVAKILRQAGDPLYASTSSGIHLGPGQEAQNFKGLGAGVSQQTRPVGQSDVIGGLRPEEVDQDVIRISYYFSAECPYCEDFEPGFSKIIEEYGDKLDVTCVDMTPSGQKVENIYGKVDCAWRPLMPGEVKSYGIKATPTLLISQGKGKPIERLSGYTGYDDLKRYFEKKF